MNRDRATIGRANTTEFVVGQYFGLFHGAPKDEYDHIVSTATFGMCNLLILAFVHTKERNGSYVAEFTDWRDGNGKYPVQPGDTDEDRVKLIVRTAREKNPDLDILISLGWGNNGAGLAAQTPQPFAESVDQGQEDH